MKPRRNVPRAQQVIRSSARFCAATVAIALGCQSLLGTDDGPLDPVEGAGASEGEGGASGGGEPGVEGGAGVTAGGNGGNGGPPITVDTFAGTPNEFGFAWKSSFYLAPCLEVQAFDCLAIQGACPDPDPGGDFENKGNVFKEEFKLGGELGKTYNVTISVNGIVEGKFYENGVRRRGADFSDYYNPAGTDAWYTGGNAVPSRYNVFKLSVFMPNGTTEVEHYYLNSFPEASGLEFHKTVPIGYTATFEVPGQGVIRHMHQNSNCRSINNCGPGDGDVCPASQNVPNEPGLVVPTTHGGTPVTDMNKVNGAVQPFHAQIVHVTVTKVELKP